jgi:hypothetical protein
VRVFDDMGGAGDKTSPDLLSRSIQRCRVIVSAFALVLTFGACIHASAIHASNRDTANSFEARRARAASGRFLDSTQLRDPPDARLVETLRVRIVGFGVARDARHATAVSEQCTLDVFVDGARSGSVDDLRAHDVAAVEYYDAPDAPVAYRRSGHSCPILLVWLRH